LAVFYWQYCDWLEFTLHHGVLDVYKQNLKTALAILGNNIASSVT